MTERVTPRRRGSYGIDALYAAAFIVALVVVELVLAILSGRALPFLALSSLAIHNISGRAGREKAVSEAVRVLRPGGRLMIADVRATGQHQAQLAKIGMNDVARRWLGWRFWMARLVTATKPEGRI